MLTTIVRILLGLLLLFAGLNKFFGFAPNPPHNEAAAAFLGALAATGYMMPLIGFFEAACGLAFVSGRYVGLAAVLLVPIALNIALFHLRLDMAGAGPGLFVAIANAYLLAVNLPKYREMLSTN